MSVGAVLRPLLVSAYQAAKLLGIGRTTLYGFIKTKAVTPVHIGRCVRFSVTELEAFVAERIGPADDSASVSIVEPTPPAVASAAARRNSRHTDDSPSLF